MQKIIPHLWFDKEAREAAEFYVSLFSGSGLTNLTTLSGTPSGDCDLVSFVLARLPFMAISEAPFFKFNLSVSFHVRCHEAGSRCDLGTTVSGRKDPHAPRHVPLQRTTDGSKRRQGSQHLLYSARERADRHEPAITARRAREENRRNRESFSAPC